MHNIKTAVIICAFIAIGAFIYYLPTTPRHSAEPPAAAAPKIRQQQVTNTARIPKAGTPKPKKQRVRTSPQIDNATWGASQPQELSRPVSSSAPAAAGQDDAAPAEDQKKREFEQKMEAFKEQYQWDTPETMNLAEHLITIVPERFRDSSLTATIKNLQEAQQQGARDTVDEVMLLESIEKTMPEKFRPALREIIAKYKQDNP